MAKDAKQIIREKEKAPIKKYVQWLDSMLEENGLKMDTPYFSWLQDFRMGLASLDGAGKEADIRDVVYSVGLLTGKISEDGNFYDNLLDTMGAAAQNRFKEMLVETAGVLDLDISKLIMKEVMEHDAGLDRALLSKLSPAQRAEIERRMEAEQRIQESIIRQSQEKHQDIAEDVFQAGRDIRTQDGKENSIGAQIADLLDGVENRKKKDPDPETDKKNTEKADRKRISFRDISGAEKETKKTGEIKHGVNDVMKNDKAMVPQRRR